MLDTRFTLRHKGQVPRRQQVTFFLPWQRILSEADAEALIGVEVDCGLRMNFHTGAQRVGAQRAAELIDSEDTVYLDAGTTAVMVAEELSDHHSLVVVTNSLAAAEVLRSSKGVNLFVVGGMYLSHTRRLTGPMAEEAIKAFRFRKMILATAGIDIRNRALTVSAPEEIPIKRVAMSQSEQVILVADNSKFGKPSLISMIPLGDLHSVVTEVRPSPEAVQTLDTMGINLIVCES